MKTTVTREAAVRHEPRTSSFSRAPAMPARPSAMPTPDGPSDWAWPGLTRAQLRDIIIDQIG